MSITIQGVPESVPRQKIEDFLNGIGIDPGEVCGLTFHTRGIEVEVCASERPENAPAYRWTHDGKNVATHRLTIPIVD